MTASGSSTALSDEAETAVSVSSEATGVRILDDTTSSTAAMIARGRARGYLTRGEVDSVLPPNQTDADRIEDAMTALSELGIAVLEDDEPGKEGMNKEEETVERPGMPRARSRAARPKGAPQAAASHGGGGGRAHHPGNARPPVPRRHRRRLLHASYLDIRIMVCLCVNILCPKFLSLWKGLHGFIIVLVSVIRPSVGEVAPFPKDLSQRRNAGPLDLQDLRPPQHRGRPFGKIA